MKITKNEDFFDKRTIITVFFLLIYTGAYGYFRHAHLYVHKCKAFNDDGWKSIVDFNRSSFSGSFWEYILISAVDTAFLPLRFLETVLHHYNFLPSSCPW